MICSNPPVAFHPKWSHCTVLQWLTVSDILFLPGVIFYGSLLHWLFPHWYSLCPGIYMNNSFNSSGLCSNITFLSEFFPILKSKTLLELAFNYHNDILTQTRLLVKRHIFLIVWGMTVQAAQCLLWKGLPLDCLTFVALAMVEVHVGTSNHILIQEARTRGELSFFPSCL